MPVTWVICGAEKLVSKLRLVQSNVKGSKFITQQYGKDREAQGKDKGQWEQG